MAARTLLRRVRNSSRIADAGRRRPASADFQEADSASCKARRSSSVRSSPSSVDHQVDNCPVRQGCGLVENEAALLDARSKTAHVLTVRVSQVPAKRSSCPTKPSIWRSQATAWFRLAFASPNHCPGTALSREALATEALLQRSAE